MNIEYQSIAIVVTKIIWLSSLLLELRIPTTIPKILLDNLGIVLLNDNPIIHLRTKHFGLNLHFLYYCMQNKFVILVHLPTHYEVEDLLTKSILDNFFIKFTINLWL